MSRREQARHRAPPTIPRQLRSIACCDEKGNATPGTPGRMRPFQKAVRMTGSKTAAAVPRLDAGVKRDHPSQENDVRQRSFLHIVRILRRFFLFIFTIPMQE